MKKIALATCYFKYNYGSMLQAYATQKVLDELKIENETINLQYLLPITHKRMRGYFINQMLTNFDFSKAKLGMIKLKVKVKLNKQLAAKIKERENKYKEFIENNFRLGKAYKCFEELTESCKEYSSVIVGSDQLWLPNNLVGDYYTLNFVPDEVNKIAYATSFGVSVVSDKYKNGYKKFLSRIDYLSVREQSGVRLCKELADMDAELVCDPTLLLTKEQWLDIQKEQPFIKCDYIFCYFLGKNKEHRQFAERLREETRYKIVSINHCDEFVKYSDKFADFIPYDVGPSEFVNLIRNAKYVCTDSFHGTVFSLINNVSFFSFRRFNNKSKASTNSRLDTLLQIVELKDRLLKGDENVTDCLKKAIDFNKVNSAIEKFRIESMEYLLRAIKAGENS